MLHNWHLSILWGRHITAGALGIRMMEFRVRVREHTSKSVICGRGTDHTVHPCARVCDGMPEPHPKSLHLIDATDVSALFYYFTNVTKHSV